jgi:F0F1-type ATP synthase, gamma subunit
MAQSLKQIKDRIRTIESTEKVTSAMELISVVKLNSTNRIAYAFKPYSLKMEAMVKHLAAAEEVRGHPFFEQRTTRVKYCCA